MSTRAASVATSQRAKQNLVNLLFKPQHARQGQVAHRRLDCHSYSYLDLRQEYLKRIQHLHPDKAASRLSDLVVGDNTSTSTVGGENDGSATNSDGKNLKELWNEELNWKDVMQSDKKKGQEAFVELQEAWTKYNKISKEMRRGRKDNDEEHGFTMFGVGCSFSDNAEESRKRAEIMDQASRGWFASAQLEDGSQRLSSSSSSKSSEIKKGSSSWRTGTRRSTNTGLKLVNEAYDEERSDGNEEYKHSSKKIGKKGKSLIDHLIPPSQRKHLHR